MIPPATLADSTSADTAKGNSDPVADHIYPFLSTFSFISFFQRLYLPALFCSHALIWSLSKGARSRLRANLKIVVDCLETMASVWGRYQAV